MGTCRCLSESYVTFSDFDFDLYYKNHQFKHFTNQNQSKCVFKPCKVLPKFLSMIRSLQYYFVEINLRCACPTKNIYANTGFGIRVAEDVRKIAAAFTCIVYFRLRKMGSFGLKWLLLPANSKKRYDVLKFNIYNISICIYTYLAIHLNLPDSICHIRY